MRNGDAPVKQMVKEPFALAESEPEIIHTCIDPCPRARFNYSSLNSHSVQDAFQTLAHLAGYFCNLGPIDKL